MPAVPFIQLIASSAEVRLDNTNVTSASPAYNTEDSEL